MLGYNVKVPVAAKHHLFVAHEATNAGANRAPLSPMAQAARATMGKSRLRAVADRGYYSAGMSRYPRGAEYGQAKSRTGGFPSDDCLNLREITTIP